MKQENKNIRKALLDTNKELVEAANRVLRLEKFIRDNKLDVPWGQEENDEISN